MKDLHRLLQRQLKRCYGRPDGVPEAVVPFLRVVSDTYQQLDADRAMLERSLDLSSHELLQANADLRAIFQALPDLFLRIGRDGRRP